MAGKQEDHWSSQVSGTGETDDDEIDADIK